MDHMPVSSGDFFERVITFAKKRTKGQKAAEMYMEYIDDWLVDNTIPHCDPRVLHSPGTCEACDTAPELQQYREMLGLQYTDELQANDALLPGQTRTRASAERWGGNR